CAVAGLRRPQHSTLGLPPERVFPGITAYPDAYWAEPGQGTDLLSWRCGPGRLPTPLVTVLRNRKPKANAAAPPPLPVLATARALDHRPRIRLDIHHVVVDLLHPRRVLGNHADRPPFLIVGDGAP